MGRATQIMDYLTRDVLPSYHERTIIYTHIGDDISLKNARKKLHLENRKNQINDSDAPF